MRIASVTAALVLQFGSQLLAQATWDAYGEKAFAQIAIERKECGDPNVEINICSDIHKFKTRVRFTGDLRPVGDQPGKFINHLIQAWANQPALSSVFATYHHEILVEQAGKQFWLPIQDSLVPDVRKSLHPGTEIIVYIAIPGAVRTNLVYLVTRFDEVQ